MPSSTLRERHPLRVLTTLDAAVEPAEVVAAARAALTALEAEEEEEEGTTTVATATATTTTTPITPPEQRRRLFCSKNAALLGAPLRPMGESLADMAKAMWAFRR